MVPMEIVQPMPRRQDDDNGSCRRGDGCRDRNGARQSRPKVDRERRALPSRHNTARNERIVYTYLRELEEESTQCFFAQELELPPAFRGDPTTEAGIHELTAQMQEAGRETALRAAAREREIAVRRAL